MTKQAWYYRLMRSVGIWTVAVFAWIVSTGYFLFRTRRVKASMRFYQQLYPNRSRLYCLLCSWKQFHSFAKVFVERLRLDAGRELSYQSKGFEAIQRADEERTGGVLVMSHLGNWEVAARLFARKGLNIMLFMGQRKDENVEKLQKQELVTDNVSVLAANRGENTPYYIIDGIQHLRRGGFVSLAGDRLGHQDQRCVAVNFLGKTIMIPRVPYEIALVAKVPLYVFFSVRSRSGYLIEILPPIVIETSKRETGMDRKARRQQAIQKAAQSYATKLEETLAKFPFQWYHFED
jgi:predicted LPLAT superfamily acyltransferase